MAMRVSRVAERLGCSVATVKRLLAAGELVGFKTRARGHWRVREDELERFVTACEGTTAEECGIERDADDDQEHADG